MKKKKNMGYLISYLDPNDKTKGLGIESKGFYSKWNCAKTKKKMLAPAIDLQNKMKFPQGRTALLLRDAKLISDYQIKKMAA